MFFLNRLPLTVWWLKFKYIVYGLVRLITHTAILEHAFTTTTITIPPARPPHDVQRDDEDAIKTKYERVVVYTSFIALLLVECRIEWVYMRLYYNYTILYYNTACILCMKENTNFFRCSFIFLSFPSHLTLHFKTSTFKKNIRKKEKESFPVSKIFRLRWWWFCWWCICVDVMHLLRKVNIWLGKPGEILSLVYNWFWGWRIVPSLMQISY